VIKKEGELLNMGLIGGDEITIRKQQVKRIKNFKLLKISCSKILRTNCYKCLFEKIKKPLD